MLALIVIFGLLGGVLGWFGASDSRSYGNIFANLIVGAVACACFAAAGITAVVWALQVWVLPHIHFAWN